MCSTFPLRMSDHTKRPPPEPSGGMSSAQRQERLAGLSAREKLAALDEVAVDPDGTPFQRRVWTALREIPPGETRTYGELALQLGTHPRAVGAANGRNPVCLAIPCHRVIASDGKLCGYAWGEERKRWLLEHERR